MIPIFQVQGGEWHRIPFTCAAPRVQCLPVNGDGIGTDWGKCGRIRKSQVYMKFTTCADHQALHVVKNDDPHFFSKYLLKLSGGLSLYFVFLQKVCFHCLIILIIFRDEG